MNPLRALDDVQLPPRRSLADEAADRLRELILLEQLAPGTPVPERDLAEALGISRTPLRDALRILEVEGLVEYGPTWRPRVAAPSLDDLRDNTLAWAATPGALYAMDTIAPDAVAVAQVTRAGGASVLRTLDEALALAQEGVIDAIVFGPFNMAAMHLAGIGHDDELHCMAEELGVTGYISELNALDGMWTSRVTSHIALRDVADAITGDRVAEAVHLIDRMLRRSGLARPRVAVAALNPHAGDGGNFGREEIDLLTPAVERLARQGRSFSCNPAPVC